MKPCEQLKQNGMRNSHRGKTGQSGGLQARHKKPVLTVAANRLMCAYHIFSQNRTKVFARALDQTQETGTRTQEFRQVRWLKPNTCATPTPLQSTAAGQNASSTLHYPTTAGRVQATGAHAIPQKSTIRAAASRGPYNPNAARPSPGREGHEVRDKTGNKTKRPDLDSYNPPRLPLEATSTSTQSPACLPSDVALRRRHHHTTRA